MTPTGASVPSPCRWKYYLSEETRPGQLYEIGENENGSYILNANDLCTAPFLDLICKAGVDSLKIEGRAKTFYYVASVTAAYRKALDQYLADPLNDDFALPEQVLEELTRTSHRHYSPGFYFGREQARQATDSATYIREWEFVGTVDGWENGIASCQQRGKWSLGDTLEALCPDGRSIPLTPEWIKNEAGGGHGVHPHAMEKYTIPTPELPPHEPASPESLRLLYGSTSKKLSCAESFFSYAIVSKIVRTSRMVASSVCQMSNSEKPGRPMGTPSRRNIIRLSRTFFAREVERPGTRLGGKVREVGGADASTHQDLNVIPGGLHQLVEQGRSLRALAACPLVRMVASCSSLAASSAANGSRQTSKARCSVQAAGRPASRAARRAAA